MAYLYYFCEGIMSKLSCYELNEILVESSNESKF